MLWCAAGVGSWAPVFFIMNCMPISAIFAKHNVKFHLYADDTQLYAEFPCEVGDAIRRIERCTADVKRCMMDHHLMLNEAKTEAIVVCASC